jgi:ABC-type multidrug transport system fused ATPase/permease subunit
MKNIKKLLFFLSPPERKRAGLLLIMIIIMALLDMIGVASILPFIAVLTNPTLVETNFILNIMFQISSIFGVETNQQFLFFLGTLVFVLLIISLTFKTFTVYVQTRFVQMREFSIGKRLVEEYLYQPYSWFLSRHSGDFGRILLSEVQLLITGGMIPLMELISKGMVAIAIISLLVFVDPKLAFVVGFSLSGIYLFIFYCVRNYLQRTGQESLKNNINRFLVVSEAFGAIKEIKIGGLEQSYVKSFSNFAQIFARTQASSRLVNQLPRFILEATAFGGILLIILYIMGQTGSFNNALPIVSLYIFAGYRLMPTLHQIYASFSQLTSIGPSLNKLYDDIKKLKSFKKNQDQELLNYNKVITLKNVYYNYPDSSRVALKNINLSIPIKSTVGLVGATGSGKTTLVDIILGLLDPQKGILEIDGKVITKKNVRSWQRLVGYVPQYIYLSDNTVAANIAFGVDNKDINKEALEKSAKIANLHHFIMDELPKQYQTIIGERGVRLSGGQRQRIGIARALYRNPQVLILDEATSSLDNETEKVVMDAVNNLNKDITIILIAHRINTVKNCDIIYKFEKGQLLTQGKFEKIFPDKKPFR